MQLCLADFGVEATHADLAANFEAQLAFDYTRGSRSVAPTPGGFYAAHGTSVASTCCGVDNRARGLADRCGVGAAPRARITAVRDVNVQLDHDTAELLGHRQDRIDIFIMTQVEFEIFFLCLFGLYV